MACGFHNNFHVGQLFNISILKGDNMKIYHVTFSPIVHIVVGEDGELIDKVIDFSSSFTGCVLKTTDEDNEDDEAIEVSSYDEQDEAVRLADSILYTLDLEQRFLPQ